MIMPAKDINDIYDASAEIDMIQLLTCQERRLTLALLTNSAACIQL